MMKKGIFAIGLIVLAFTGLFLWSLIPAGGDLAALWASLQEQLTGETPEAKIAAYIHAVSERQGQAALDVWELPDWDTTSGRWAPLIKRRQKITQELVAADIQSDFFILATEWWRTCCEPGVITNTRNAGGARVWVELHNGRGVRQVYIFDVWVRGNAYWGAAMGYPPRQWVLRDVYPEGQTPLFWQFTN
jgi:hypothetical protein